MGLVVVLSIVVCTFAVIGVVSVIDGDDAALAPHDKPRLTPGGLIVEPRYVPLELAVSKRAITNCTSVGFTGHIPPEGVPVSLQARPPGGRWLQFAVAYGRRDGSFETTYDFTRTTTKTRYRFRAVIEPSAPTSVLVTPLRAGSTPPRRECAAPPWRRR